MSEEFIFETAQGDMKFAFFGDEELWLFRFVPATENWVSVRKATGSDLGMLKRMQKIKQNFVFDVDSLLNNPRRA